MHDQRKTASTGGKTEMKYEATLQLSYFKPSTEAALPSHRDSAGTARPITAGLYVCAKMYLHYYIERGFMGKPGALTD